MENIWGRLLWDMSARSVTLLARAVTGLPTPTAPPATRLLSSISSPPRDVSLRPKAALQEPTSTDTSAQTAQLTKTARPAFWMEPSRSARTATEATPSTSEVASVSVRRPISRSGSTVCRAWLPAPPAPQIKQPARPVKARRRFRAPPVWIPALSGSMRVAPPV